MYVYGSLHLYKHKRFILMSLRPAFFLIHSTVQEGEETKLLWEVILSVTCLLIVLGQTFEDQNQNLELVLMFNDNSV